jgi:hypothetical protein
MSKAIPFASSDAWLLHAILLVAIQNGSASLDEVVGAADGIEHAMLTFDEIDGGVARLSRAGLIAIRDKRFHLTRLGMEMGRRISTLSGRKADEALRKEFGIPPPKPPFGATPADPAWTSDAFTIEDLRRAEEAYRQRFADLLRRSARKSRADTT